MKVVEKKKGDEEWFGKQQASLTTEQPLGGFSYHATCRPAIKSITQAIHPRTAPTRSRRPSRATTSTAAPQSFFFFRVLLVLQARVVFMGNLFGFTTPCIRRYLPITSS